MMKIIVEEPKFNDSPSRCFTLPFVVTEAFSTESKHISELLFPSDEKDRDVLDTLMLFVSVDDEYQLNSTLAGYFNKIISFMLIRHPNAIIRYLAADSSRYLSIVKHIYLNSSIVDLVIRICAVQGLTEANLPLLDDMRIDILNTIANALEHTYEDDFMTE